MQHQATSRGAGIEPPSAPGPFAYDQLPYPGLPFAQTHPGRLATLAALHGMQPAPPARCRVLELGCGDGGNVIPMACHLPESVFIGVDLSAPAIERGRRIIGEVGLRNIELHAGDIAELGPELGEFDYIIAHGVYSWVPPAIRAKILSIFGDCLAPQGVAFVSYNCYPGSYLRDLTRAMMLFHVRAIPDPQQRTRQASALIHALAQASNENDLYGQLLRSQSERIRTTNPAVLYHDDLDAGATPFFLHQVLEEAARCGLQYLTDAHQPLLDVQDLPEPVAKLLGQIPPEDWVVREQYFDFVSGRWFRDTLLCRHTVELRRPVAADRIRDFYVSAEIVTTETAIDPGKIETAAFKTWAGGTISTDHGLAKAALLHLGSIWPRAIRMKDLAAAAVARLGPAAEGVKQNFDEELEALTAILFRSFCARLVQVEAFPPPLTAGISERPQASLLARKQAEAGNVITDLQHCAIVLEEAICRRLLTLLDGTRTVDQLVTDLTIAVPAADGANGTTGMTAAQPVVSREAVMRNLQLLARCGLLVA